MGPGRFAIRVKAILTAPDKELEIHPSFTQTLKQLEASDNINSITDIKAVAQEIQNAWGNNHNKLDPQPRRHSVQRTSRPNHRGRQL